jgi:hypothetical protein
MCCITLSDSRRGESIRVSMPSMPCPGSPRALPPGAKALHPPSCGPQVSLNVTRGGTLVCPLSPVGSTRLGYYRYDRASLWYGLLILYSIPLNTYTATLF